ncbi:ankyrin repeat, bromo and BTB domain-containing protein [Iris pallida]|uniref:Ankyrin repeat, bromo and BTB domain-containing protein n=1 Tax=Iris pallida TaxID=29817 RepID=A0AAX6I3C7_IRIPA|nr:ankyrin repeat, bromo and BTB domain-containing protein [Iris pallida]
MKRKRGSKKGHKKVKIEEPPVITDPSLAPFYINTKDTACFDQSDESQHNSEMDIGPSHTGSDKPSNLSSSEADLPDGRLKGKVGHSRLRVKLKSSKAIEPHKIYSDVQTPSDTDKSNQKAALELNDAAVEKDDSAYSDGQTSELQTINSEKLPRKGGTIKIISLKGLGFPSDGMQDKSFNKKKSPQMLGERNLDLVLSDDKITADSLASRNLQQKEMKRPYRDPHYKEKELSDAFEVIKKIMKMDAAVPFNAPVNPIALGIPDYFDIIETPMDFGTISHNLEHGYKYLNSEDVYKDVQYIWENCYKYNNKGDYIVDLMKRVKKNFMKYWMVAGLYLDMPSNGVINSTMIEDSKGKLHQKGKPKHKCRKYGIDLHKSDCLCAVCVMRRRRKEREQNSAVIEDQVRTEGNLSRELKLEESSPAANQCSEDASSSLDQSQETDANADTGGFKKEETMTPEEAGTDKPENQEAVDYQMEVPSNASGSSGPCQEVPLDNEVQEDSSKNSQEEETDLGFTGELGEKDDIEVQQQDQVEERDQGESADRSKLQITVHENYVQQENHSVLHICKNLFPNDFRSVWYGPHSLKQHHASRHRDSPIHSALASFMKQ